MEIAKKKIDLDSLRLEDVIDIEVLQRFQDDFAKGMGLASVTVDQNGVPVTRPSGYTNFCLDYTHSTEVGDKRCAKSHKRGGEEAARLGKPFVYECHAGLIDFAAPIILEGHLLGTMLGGQVLINKPVNEKYEKIAKEIGVDQEGYLEAVNEINILDKERIEAAANVLFVVANNMSESAYHQRQLQASVDTLTDSLHQISATMQELAASATDVSDNQVKLNSEIKNVDEVTNQINIENVVVGCIVDEVTDIIRIDEETIKASPTFVKQDDYIKGIVKVEDRIIIILDSDQIITKDGSESLDLYSLTKRLQEK